MKLGELLEREARFEPRFGALDISGISADSRAVKPGFLFAAVPGTKADGLAFLPQALAAGAGAVMAERAPAGPLPDGVAFVEVPNVRRRSRARRGKILSPPARDHRRRHRHQRQDLGRGLHAPGVGAR